MEQSELVEAIARALDGERISATWRDSNALATALLPIIEAHTQAAVAEAVERRAKVCDEWRKDCETCCGEGTVERADMPLHHLHSEAPEYAVVTCDDCDGEGWRWTDEFLPLRNCPVGLFLHGDTLCLKTEYGNNEGRIDAYIVSTGEFFWGSAPQTISNQRDQMVRPVELDCILPAIRSQSPLYEEGGR